MAHLVARESTSVSSSTQKMNQTLQNTLKIALDMGIVGLSVAIGTPNALLWQGTAGFSDLQAGIPVNIHDRFCIGSITKTFVSRVILQLVQEKQIDLDKTIPDYLQDPLILSLPNIDKATLRHLLHHQSGIPNWEDQPAWIRRARGDHFSLDKTWTRAEPLQYVSRNSTSALYSPGEKCTYSNTNYTLLGLLIEKITGNTLRNEIRKRILLPLTLKATYMDSFEQHTRNRMHHYHFITPRFMEKAGISSHFAYIKPDLIETTASDFSCEWAAGGMFSTASDLLHWAQSLYKGDLLQKRIRHLSKTYQPPLMPDNTEDRYFFGLHRIVDFYPGQNVIGHGGGTLGFTSKMYWLEGKGLMVALLSNTGIMHTGIKPSPIGKFFKDILFPTAKEIFL